MEIYGLFDPETEELRYVGKTEEALSKRLAGHLAPSSMAEKSHKNNWIKQLARYGLKPRMRTIQKLGSAATGEDLNGAEIYWIKFFRDQGCRLTNTTNGGDSVMAGRRHTQRSKDKIAAASAGRKHSQGAKDKVSVAHSGRIHSSEIRARMSAAHKGKVLTPDHRANIAAASKNQSKDTRAKISAAMKGRKKSPEAIANMRAAQRARSLAAREGKK